MSKIYIVAGNEKQARAWAAEGHLHKDNFEIIIDVNQLRGLRNFVIAYVGTYFTRSDLEEIRDYVKAYNSAKPPTPRET